MTAILLLIGIVAFTILSGIIVRKKDYITLGSLGIALFVCSYVIVSGLLMWIDKFSIIGATLLTILFGGGLDAFFLFVQRRRFTCRAFDKRMIIPCVILVISLLMTVKQFGIYGFGQDQGVYQLKAIALRNGYNANELDFEEYGPLDDYRKEQYQEFMTHFEQWLTTSDDPDFDPATKKSDVSGYFLGIQTTGAVYGLSAKAFGLRGLNVINIINYLALIGLVYACARDMKYKMTTRILIMLTTGVSPLLIWMYKGTYAETIETLAIVAFIYLMINAYRHFRTMVLFAALPACTISFNHITAVFLIPLLMVIVYWAYVKQRDTRYLWVQGLICAGLITGQIAMRAMAPAYTYTQYVNATFDVSFMDVQKFILLPYALTAVAALFGVLFYFVDIYKWKRVIDFILGWAYRAIFVFACYKVGKFVLAFHNKEQKYFSDEHYQYLRKFYFGKDFYTVFQYSRIYAIMFFAGFIAVAILFVIMFVKPQKFLDKHFFIIGVAAAYMMLVPNMILQQELYYYYYYARYVTYVIPLVTLCCGIVYDTLPRPASISVAAISVAAVLPFSLFNATNYDTTRMQAKELVQICDVIEPNSAVIINTTSQITERIVTFPIKFETDAAIYPMFDRYTDELAILQQMYDHVYMITDETDSDDKILEVRSLKEEYDMRTDWTFQYSPLMTKTTKDERIISVLDKTNATH